MQSIIIIIMFFLYNLPYGAKFWRGKILTNEHVENFDEKNFDEFHNVNTHIY